MDFFREFAEKASEKVFKSDDFDWSMMMEFRKFTQNMCKFQLENEKLLEELKAGKFDIAIGHMYDLCWMGLIHVVQIPTYIWMSSGVLLDYMANYLGVPMPPSYSIPSNNSTLWNGKKG